MDQANRNGSFVAVLRNRNFLYLWLAQLISLTILNSTNYALLAHIGEVTHSTTQVGLAIICFSLPAVLFGAPAGVFVDRMNKRTVLWSSNCLRAIATLVFVLSLLVNRNAVLPMYLLTFLISAIGQFFTPAESSAIPMLVKEEELMPALSLFNITFMLSQALGFLILAPLALIFLPTFQIFNLTIHSTEQLYMLVALLYLVCAVLILFIPESSLAQKRRTTVTGNIGPVATETIGIIGNVWQEMMQGWSFVRREKPLFLAVVQLSFAGVLMLVISQLATPIVTQLLHFPADNLALVFAPAGIGLVVGSILMPQITSHMPRWRAIFIGAIILTMATLLIPLLVLLAQYLQPVGWNKNPLLLLAMALIMFCAGFALDFINIPAQTAIQELTPEWLKGRVIALQMVLYNACSIPIILFMGAFADIFSVNGVLYLMSACELAFGLWGIWYERKHRIMMVEEPLQQEGQSEQARDTLPR
jgi:MFS family permease